LVIDVQNQKFQFEIELRRRGGALVAREAVAPGRLRPLVDDALWRAQRRGIVGPRRSLARWDLEPVFAGAGAPRVEGIDLRVEAEGGRFSRRYGLGVFREPAASFRDRLVVDAAIARDEEIEIGVRAIEPQLVSPGAAPPGVEIRLEEPPLPLTPGSLRDLLARSRPHNPEAEKADDAPVFILGQALEEARSHCRSGDSQSHGGGALEGAAFLVGRLHADVDHPEIFAVIEAALEARHALRERFSVEPTAETYRDLESRIAVRRRLLGRPEEILLATAHAHPFAPSISRETGKAQCPECPLRAECKLDSAFWSADDARYTESLFVKAPHGVGLVWGLSPRFEDVLRVYGFRDGVMEERGIRIVDGTGSR
jgi:hypothetical protein